MTESERLGGGWQTEVHREGDIVYRTARPHSATVIALLRHLHANGFEAAPRPVGSGFGADGREQLSFVDGRSPLPAAWSDEAAFEIGQLLCRLHECASTFDPGPNPNWQPWFGRHLPGDRPVIGHGDLGPWNILARSGRPVAFIDWDTAGPIDALWELAQVAWLNAQLHDDDVAALNDLPSAADRIGQFAAIVDGYALDTAGREVIVERMIELAIHSARDEAVQHGVTTETTSPAANGFPTLWAVAWRTRAAAWMLDHRCPLEAAVNAAAR